LERALRCFFFLNIKLKRQVGSGSKVGGKERIGIGERSWEKQRHVAWVDANPSCPQTTVVGEKKSRCLCTKKGKKTGEMRSQQSLQA
jgi:hypothetical protein